MEHPYSLQAPLLVDYQFITDFMEVNPRISVLEACTNFPSISI